MEDDNILLMVYTREEKKSYLETDQRKLLEENRIKDCTRKMEAN